MFVFVFRVLLLEEGVKMTVSMDETWFKWTRGKPIAFRWHDARRQHALAVAGKEITNLIGKLLIERLRGLCSFFSKL